MKSEQKIFIIFIVMLIFFSQSIVGASDISVMGVDDAEIEQANLDSDAINISTDVIKSASSHNSEDICASPIEEDLKYHSNESQNTLQSTAGSGEIVVVDNWQELQYYCAQTDRDYTLKLKENTNFYPANVNDVSNQIVIKNSVTIIGSSGSYIGDDSENPQILKYAAFSLPSDCKKSVTLKNILFKSINSSYSPGDFIQIAGKGNHLIQDCSFENVYARADHASLIYITNGVLTVRNCSFINCTSENSCVSIDGDVKATVTDCYFENNYARSHTGCIKNRGAHLTVVNSTFYKNRSYWWAGAIFTYNNGNTTIRESNFTDNVAGWNGGALYTYAYLQIYNSVFKGNNCTTNNGGGAIGACFYSSVPHIYIEGCLFENNANNDAGSGRGGAISIMDEGSIEVRNTDFIANSASIGAAICAWSDSEYGYPDIIIANNSFINHTRSGDTLNVRTDGSPIILENNTFFGNSILFSNLTLTKLSEGKEQASFEITAALSNPGFYDEDILDKTSYDVYINDRYVKTVISTIFDIDFDELDICDVYVVPTVSNRKSNAVTAISTRDYIFVSKANGNDTNTGVSRDDPVNTIKKALELAETCRNIILLDGNYSEDNIRIDYDVTLKGEGNAALTGNASFISNSNFTLKNLKINNLNSEPFINNTNCLTITNCIITDNNVLLVLNSGFASLSNSILLNNSDVIQGNNCTLNYNWWGASLPDLGIDTYVTLNLTSSSDSLENGQNANVKAIFCLNDETEYFKLPQIAFDITAVNGVSNKNVTGIDSTIIYTLTGFDDGVLTFSHNDFSINKTFKFLKSNPTMALALRDIMFGDNLTIKISLPDDAEGNLTVSVGNITQNQTVESKITVFTFTNLKADNYTVSANYSGDKKYVSRTESSHISVNRYQSATSLNISEISVGEDVILTVKVTESATGNITLSINNDTQTLILNDSMTNYTIKSIKRGDYRITAVYNGDDKYLASEDSIFIEVDNLNATMTIRTQNITYGDTAVIKITLNDDATGNVIVTVDNMSDCAELSDGNSEVRFDNLEAGIKNVSVFYTGDDTYFNLTDSAHFSIAKADLAFTIESEDIMVGQTARIIITVPEKTEGTFTIGDEIKSIPLLGEITFLIRGLEIGNYTYTATYEGNNYNTVSKNTSFEVHEYPFPQWANDGGDTKNTQKSPYETLTDDKILFEIPFNHNLTGNLAIDSVGNLYITAENGIYCYNKTTSLWNFTSSTVLGNFSGIAICRDVIAAPKSGDTLYFINQTTGERYGRSNIYQASSLFAPVIDSNAALYVVSEYHYDSDDYKLVIVPYNAWESGGEITEISLGNAKPLCSPTLNDDIIVVVCENKFRIIDAKTLKTITSRSGNFQPVRPVIDDSNTVYFILSNSIVAYNNVGSQVWKTKVTGGVGDTLAVDDDGGYVYHVNAKGALYRYGLFDGKEELVSSLNVTSKMLIGENGNLYFASENIFYGLDSNGNQLWHADLGSKVIGNPIMDKNGTIYVKTETGVVALGQIILKPSSVNIATESISYGEDLIVNIILNDNATGSVNVTVGDKTLTGDLINSSASFVFTGLNVGSYIIYADYAGDSNFNRSSNTSSVIVNKAKPEIAASADAIAYGENLIVNVRMPSDVSRRPQVTVGNETKYVTLKNGAGSVKFGGLKAGKHTVTVSYGGDSLYEKESVNITATVSKAQANIKITADAINYGDNLVVSITMPSDVSKRPQVTVGNESKFVSMKNGTGSVSFKGLKIGKYDVTVSYAGDNNYLKTEKSATARVNRGTADIKITASNINYGETLNVTIKLPSDVTRRAKVTVDNESKTVSLKDGEATVKFTGLSRGKHTITVTYDGDNNYLKSTANKTVTVNKGSADIKVTAKAISYGDTLKVVVDLPADTTRRATVTVGNESKYVSLKSNTAEFTELTAGTHEITVSYGGDDNYLKTVVTANAKVNKATPEIEITADDIFEGETLKVDVRLPEGVTRRAMVSIGDTSKYVTLKNGIGTAKFTGLTTGSYKVKATYDGDANYKASSSTISINVK